MVNQIYSNQKDSFIYNSSAFLSRIRLWLLRWILLITIWIISYGTSIKTKHLTQPLHSSPSDVSSAVLDVHIILSFPTMFM